MQSPGDAEDLATAGLLSLTLVVGHLALPVSAALPRWLSEPLARTHRAIRTVSNDGGQATYYEFVEK